MPAPSAGRGAGRTGYRPPGLTRRQSLKLEARGRSPGRRPRRSAASLWLHKGEEASLSQPGTRVPRAGMLRKLQTPMLRMARGWLGAHSDTGRPRAQDRAVMGDSCGPSPYGAVPAWDRRWAGQPLRVTGEMRAARAPWPALVSCGTAARGAQHRGPPTPQGGPVSQCGRGRGQAQISPSLRAAGCLPATGL